jgi:hypothetical protein
MRKIALLLALALLAFTAFLVVGSSSAVDATGAYYVYDTTSCGQLVSDRQSNPSRSFADKTWAAGYLTAYNRLAKDNFNITGTTDLESVMLWLDGYCRANPLSSLPDGMSALTDSLYPTRQKRH